MSEILTSAERLLEVIGRLRRRTRRLAGSPLGGPQLTPAQVELVRHLRRNDGCTVSDAAAALELAPNTVSTLVGTLVRRGDVQRTPDPGDRRSVRLSLTSATRERVERWRDRRAELIAEAIGQLPQHDRDLLERALGSLEHLVDALEAEPEAAR